jgi:hypothetical protein
MNDFVLHVASFLGVATITSLMALTTFASVARFF